MTLEINEISIQISVSTDPPSPAVSPLKHRSGGSGLEAEQIDQLVQRCVRDVLRHLRLRGRR